jgi:hypothetical protein
MLVLMEIIGRRLVNEEKGVFKSSSPFGKNATPDGPVIGYFS